MKYAAILSLVALRLVAAESTAPAFVTDLVAGMKQLDTAVLQFGAEDPRPILAAYSSLLVTVKAATSAAAAFDGALPVSAADAGLAASPSTPIATAGSDLVRDIKSTKWAFQLGGICDKAFAAVNSLSAEYSNFFAAVAAKAVDRPALQAQVAGLETLVVEQLAETATLLGPGSCINQIGGAPVGASGNSTKVHVAVSPSKDQGEAKSATPAAVRPHPHQHQNSSTTAATAVPTVLRSNGTVAATTMATASKTKAAGVAATSLPEVAVNAGAVVKGFSFGAVALAIAAMVM